MVKYIFFILIALLIDGLQFFLDLAFTAIGAVSGTLGGAAAGAYVCSPAGATVQSLCAAAGGFLGTFTNPALAAIMVPLCAFLGFVIGVVISLTIGSGLIFLLAYNGMYYPKPMGIGFITEIMPGFDMLPGWTTMVVICVFKDAGLSAQGVLGFAGSVGSVMQQKAGNAQQEAPAVCKTTRNRPKTPAEHRWRCAKLLPTVYHPTEALQMITLPVLQNLLHNR
jgi:hypothetical protein